MHIARSTLLVASLSIAAFALQGKAEAARRNADRPTRDATIERCSAKAMAEAPVIPESNGFRRTQIYNNCMLEAGFPP